MAAAEEITVDAAIATGLSELDDSFTLDKEHKNGTKDFYSVDKLSASFGKTLIKQRHTDLLAMGLMLRNNKSLLSFIFVNILLTSFLLFHPPNCHHQNRIPFKFLPCERGNEENEKTRKALTNQPMISATLMTFLWRGRDKNKSKMYQRD